VNRPLLDGESLITPKAIAMELASTGVESDGRAFDEAKAELALILNFAQQQFEQGRSAGETIQRLITQLHALRKRLEPGVWQALLPIAHHHPVSALFHQDPFTRWSFEKPRGYSGDAHLLDFIYGHGDVGEEVAKASPLGKALYGYTSQAPAPVAVRERCHLLTQQVDEIANSHGPGAEILTIAAGHLREANGSVALREGRLRRWVALDQDPLCVGSITRDFHGTRVEAIDGSVRGLLTKAYKLGTFDFVYSAGLYDYLSHRVAVKLTQRCLELLKPGGVLLFANFARDIPDDGYMETFMNWALLLRSEDDMWNIINDCVDRNTVEASVHFGANRNIVYGTIRKLAEVQATPASSVAQKAARFEAVLDPSDLWLVWDLTTDLPAEYDGKELFGLAREEALRYSEELNKSGGSQFQVDSYS